MSDQPTLSLAAGYHLRAKALCDGRVGLKSFELRAIAYENDGLGHDQFMAGKYDTGEFSLANYLRAQEPRARRIWRSRFSQSQISPLLYFRARGFAADGADATRRARRSAFPAGSTPRGSGRAAS